jgi:hypothetical protein
MLYVAETSARREFIWCSFARFAGPRLRSAAIEYAAKGKEQLCQGWHADMPVVKYRHVEPRNSP